MAQPRKTDLTFVDFLIAILKIVFGIFAIFCGPLAWITHVIVCIKSGSWILLVIGAIIVPIGIIHGIAVWLGIL